MTYKRLVVKEAKTALGRTNLYGKEFNSKHIVPCKRHGGTVVLVNCANCHACRGMGRKQVWCAYEVTEWGVGSRREREGTMAKTQAEKIFLTYRRCYWRTWHQEGVSEPYGHTDFLKEAIYRYEFVISVGEPMKLDLIRDAMIAEFERKNDCTVAEGLKRFEAEMKIPTSKTRLAWELEMERLSHLANGAL